MKIGRFLTAFLIASFLVAVAAVIAPQATQAQCLPAGVPCPPPPPGGGGEKKRRPPATPFPTPKAATGANLVPLPIAPVGAAGDGSGQPGPNGSISPNGGNEPTLTRQPGLFGFSLLTNPWGLVGILGVMILIGGGGIYYFFEQSKGHHTLLGDTGGTMPGNTADGFYKLMPAGQELSGGVENGTMSGMENGTMSGRDLAANLENATIARPDVTGNLQNATIDAKDVGEMGGAP